MAVQVTTTTTADVVLSPALKKRLLHSLHEFRQRKADIKEQEASCDKLKAEIDILRDMTGELSISLEGYTVSMVAGTRSTLSKEKLIALGVTTAMLDMATVTVPVKPFTKITCPKED